MKRVAEILIRKTKSFFAKVSIFILSILALPVVFIIRILQPFVVIRLRRLDIGRFGHPHIADWYLCERQNCMHGKKNYDIFYFYVSTNSISNSHWVKMWQRVLRVFPFGQFALAVDKVNRILPEYASHIIPDYDQHPPPNDTLNAILACSKSFLSFTNEEEALGQKVLQELGIPDGVPFICFHARDSAYLDTVYPQRNWRYHDYRDSHIHNYLFAVKKLVKRGYYAIRMGNIVKEKITTDNPAIIDYATNGKRTDFLDIYLGAKCRFFICSDAGISVVPEIFRRPAVYTNWVLIKYISRWVHNGLFIFKKFYLVEEKHFLTFREILNLKIGNYHDSESYKQQGIELIENTPEEIAAAAIEMDERLKGTWEPAPEDEKLQQRFWEIFGNDKLKSPDLRIGAEYLRKNRELLDI